VTPRWRWSSSESIGVGLACHHTWDADWFEVLGVGTIGDVGGERGEAVTIISVVVSIRSVPFPCLNDAPRVATIIDLLP
jgi:hypothetical protein